LILVFFLVLLILLVFLSFGLAGLLIFALVGGCGGSVALLIFLRAGLGCRRA
jgi:hypothetical protein